MGLPSLSGAYSTGSSAKISFDPNLGFAFTELRDYANAQSEQHACCEHRPQNIARSTTRNKQGEKQ